ncbi:MAG: tetratricopeptide repeat protein [Chloroflexota bacterium]|nr:tetratricopeptide repeat protein [Chloroflexota bacterium]
MAKFGVFVGRKEELDLIDEWAEKRDTMHVIAVHGDGGVGKTWLLLQVLQRYGHQDDFAVVYFDAAEHTFSIQYEMMFLVQHLGLENFPRLLAGLEELTRSYYDLPILDAQARERQVLQMGVDEINEQLRTRRLIYLSDTLEVLEYGGGESLIGLEEYEYASQFSNALFISAGRNIEEMMPDLVQDFGPDNVTCVDLHNFDRVESAEFFDAVDKEGFISPDMRDKLYLLTNGRPVLLSLAVEWLSRDVPLPEIAEQSREDLRGLPEAEQRKLSERFEFELVDRVRGLKRPLDRAVLYMAHIHRRTDIRLLSVLLDISTTDAQELMQQLTDLSFVKYNPTTGNCMLHDEMKNLVNQHAWPYVDPTGDVRRKLARKVVTDYYEPRINELAVLVRAQLESDVPSKGPVRRTTIGGAEWEQWRLEAESLYYRLQADADDGLTYFDDRFEEAQRNNHLMRMQFLLNEMEVSGHTGIRDTLMVRRAQELLVRGAVEQAGKICQDLMAKKEDLSPDNRVDIHNILGVIAASTDPEQARQQYQAALQLAQDEDKVRMIGVVHNNIGRLYQQTSHLDRAIQHYQQAIEHSKRTDNLPLVASATNNMAYVYRLQGNLSQADVLCRVALAQRKRLGIERDLAYSYLTKGEIDRDRGDLESAERYTKLALRSFDKVSAIRGQIMAYRSLANIRRHIEQYEEAGTYLERGISLAEQIHDEPLLASLLNVYGRQQRDRAVYMQEVGAGDTPEAIEAFFQSAEEYLERSLDIAAQYGDEWLITRSQFELALAYFLSASRPDDYVARLLDEVWENASRLEYVLLQGYVEETRGEIAHRQQNYAAAARHFGLAAQLIAQRRGREQERFFDRLGDRLLDTRLSPQALHTLAHGILNVLQESTAGEMDESLQSLQMLCQQVLDLPVL